MALPLGWRTDLAVLAAGGSEFEDHGDHLVVRTAANPSYHWGNFVLVTDPSRVDEAEHWRAVFASAFPGARHLAVGLPAQPDVGAWAGTAVEASDVLIAEGELVARPLPPGYTVHAFATDADWAASTDLNDQHYPGQVEFARLRSAGRARMAAAGALTWFGAFTEDGRLVSELGIAEVDEGTARYQSVLTHVDHRRRGLTGHLLGVAAEHARRGRARSLVIIADADGDAGRLYRSAGFRHAETVWQAYSVPEPRASIA